MPINSRRGDLLACQCPSICCRRIIFYYIACLKLIKVSSIITLDIPRILSQNRKKSKNELAPRKRKIMFAP